MRGIRRFIWLAFMLGSATSVAHAWSHHAWGTWLSLSVMPDARSADAAVRAEPLERFLIEQGTALEAVLQQEEQWARSKVRNYPARPEVLAYRFDPHADPAELRRRFLMALRVHPATPLPLHVQVLPLPASQTAYAARPSMSWSEVSLHKEEPPLPRRHVAVKEGEWVSLLDVIATATDEPDDGMDSGLWTDSGTEHGRVYGFGRQPLSERYGKYGDESPLHMGFFHESASTYATANGLRRTYPDYRMHLWQTLARYALVNGHPYWGWRFAGWAMHYAQDLTQPYHTRYMPARGALGVAWMNVLDMAGVSDSRQQVSQVVANRQHLLDLYQQQSMLLPLQKGEMNHPNLKPFMSVTSDAGRMALPEYGLRDIVALQAHRHADEIDAWVTASFPARWVNDPHANLSKEATGAMYQQMQSKSPPALEGLDQKLRELSQHFGTATRAIWRRLQ